MRQLCWIAIDVYLSLTISLASSALVLALAPTRAVPVTEDTPTPGTISTSYATCSSLDLSDFTAAIFDASNECAVKATYSWSGTALPTTVQRRELCTCRELILKIQEVQIPRCSLVREGQAVSYAALVQYAFGLCSPTGGLEVSVTNANKTTAPTIASSTPTTSPSPTREPAVTNPTDATTLPTKRSNQSKVGLIVAVVGGLLIVIVVVVFLAFRWGRWRRAAAKRESNHDVIDIMPLSPVEPYRTVTSTRPFVGVTKDRTTIASTGDRHLPSPTVSSTETAMWDDPVLLAVRVPYDTVFFGPLLSRGGYGEVFRGTYRGETVAIKQLLSERRKDLVQIDAFLSEAKLMSTLEHERIVHFIGVAWNALSDVCVVVEYMGKGDLRSVLTQWESGEDGSRPQGFDAEKVKIALHTAHALTYLHSLQPMVVHRDLKSKNILLDANYDAKLTDFGVSRERADSTMTGGVGSSLWMAPEVMLGERYDEKADVFSFGVVLSELDTHQLPYAHAKEIGTERRLPDSAILQMVSLGRLQIRFTDDADRELTQIGRDCVQLDATKRPTSAQVLHRVHQVLRNFNQ